MVARIKIRCEKLVLTISILMIASVPNLYGATLSFHHLFPMTWYEKSLNAIIFALYGVCKIVDEKIEELPVEVFDTIIGRDYYRDGFAHL